MSSVDFVPDRVKFLAQIPVNPDASTETIQRTYSRGDTAEYLLGYAAIGLVAALGFAGLWLKKYFETRLEMSIKRQEQEFADAKEDRDKAQRVFDEDRKRAQDQADLFLTTTLTTIKEEKENNLNALNRVALILEKVDVNQSEMMHQITELKGEVRGTGVRVENVQSTIENIQGVTQTWEGVERRKFVQ